MMSLSRRPEALMPGLPCCSCPLETLSWIPCTAPHLHHKVLPVFLLVGCELLRPVCSCCLPLFCSLFDFALVLLILQHVSSQAHWAFGRSLAFECVSSSPLRPFLHGFELLRTLECSCCSSLLHSLLDLTLVLLILQHVSSQAHWAFGRSLAFDCASSSPHCPCRMCLSNARWLNAGRWTSNAR